MAFLSRSPPESRRIPWMRLYFHLQKGTEIIRDEEGVEVSNVKAGKLRR